MNLQENINRIKSVMGLLNESKIEDHIKDLLIKRIPFLKEYNIFEHPRDPRRLETQRIVYNKNVQVVMKDEIATFPQLNVSSEVYYYPHEINDITFHYFGIKNDFHPMPPEDMDELTRRIIFYMFNAFRDKMSYSAEIMVRDGEEFPMDRFDEIINEMNGNLFQIEEYTQKYRIDLF
jgi:hypothetical protein